MNLSHFYSHRPFVLAMVIFLFIMFMFGTVTGHGHHNDEREVGVINDKDAGSSKVARPKIESEGQRLLVISLDGFRYDFLEINGTTTFAKIASKGVRARCLTSSYITKTFPNHHSIATGLYEESHGIVANLMWDPDWNSSFHSCSEPHCGKWYGGQPIWNSNELNNHNDGAGNYKSNRFRRHGDTGHEAVPPVPKTSGVIYWPGITANINNMTITFSERYIDPYSNDSSYMNLRQRFDKVVTWFTDDKTPVNLAMVYYEYPDKFCHHYGPESAEVSDKVREIDGDLAYLLEQLESKNLLDTTNILIVSDHGFADVEGYLYLEDCITNITEYRVINNSPIVSIWPSPNGSDVDFLYDTLKKCDGYVVHRNPSDELKHFHYSNNRRIAPIIVSTKYPPQGSSAKLIVTTREHNFTTKGSHGWDNGWDKMHAVFLAYGPSFKKGVTHESFDNVNIYPLMCALLGIKCPASNGSLEVVKDMLQGADNNNNNTTLITMTSVALLCAIVSGIMIIGVCKSYSTSPRHHKAKYRGSYSLQSAVNMNSEQSTLMATSDEEF